MSDLSHVAAALGGKPDAVRQFSEAIKTANISDNDEILRLFKFFNRYNDLSIYTFYLHHIAWFGTSENTWHSLCELAEKFKLSWVFYRAGIECYDTDWSDNSDESYFDNRMFGLFQIQHPIRIIDPVLKILER